MTHSFQVPRVVSQLTATLSDNIFNLAACSKHLAEKCFHSHIGCTTPNMTSGASRFICAASEPETGSMSDENDGAENMPSHAAKKSGAEWSQDHHNTLLQLMQESEANLNTKPGTIKKLHPAFRNIDSKTMGNRVRGMRTTIVQKNSIDSESCLLFCMIIF